MFLKLFIEWLYPIEENEKKIEDFVLIEKPISKSSTIIQTKKENSINQIRKKIKNAIKNTNRNTKRNTKRNANRNANRNAKRNLKGVRNAKYIKQP